jgi:hypothetical protein
LHVVLPQRDALSLAIWACGGVGRTVFWRGRRLLIEGDGLVVPRPEPASATNGTTNGNPVAPTDSRPGA